MRTGMRNHLRRVRRSADVVRVAVVCGLALGPGRVHAQASAVTGRGAAVVVTTTASTQQFATVSLPSSGGMVDSELTSIAVPSAISADGLVSITTGQFDEAVASATTTAEAANVNLLNGLITARAVVAVVTSYANGGTAGSESNGSALVGLVVNGVAYANTAPAPNTRVSLPGVGYVVLHEQIPAGDGVTSSGLTVNMIHVVLTDPVGAKTGEIIVGAATSSVTR